MSIVYLFSEPVFLIFLTFWYQFIDHKWFLIQLIFFILTLIALLYYIFVVPESPKWLYTWKRFQEAKDVLARVARFNFVDQNQINEIKTLKFDAEEEDDGQSSKKSIAGYQISTWKYVGRLVVQSL